MEKDSIIQRNVYQASKSLAFTPSFLNRMHIIAVCQNIILVFNYFLIKLGWLY